MRTILLVPIALAFSAATAVAGPCPATLTDDEAVPGAPGTAPVDHKFRYVSFYVGDPKDQTDLAPDDGPNPAKLEQRWELTRGPGEKITMVCRYHGTDKTIASVLPPNVKSCTLSGETDGHGGVIGSPTLECK